MIRLSPIKLMLLGFLMMVFGILVPFVTVIHLLEPNLFLNMLAYITSVLGLMVGVLGISQYGQSHRRDQDR